MASLRRNEAAERSGLLRPVSYRAQLDLRSAESFTSSTTIRFEATSAGETFADVRPRALLRAALNGVDVDPAALDAEAGRLPLTVTAGPNELVVDAEMSYSHDGEGLVQHVDPADGERYLYAMSFLDAAPRWFACFDQPDLKAPVTLDVTAPDGWTVAGNGPAVSDAPGRWTIEQPRPLATYFTTLVAGPYHSVRGEHDGIPLALHARASLSEHLDRDAPALLAHTARCLDEFHRLFGSRYPWGEYHQAFVPDFNAGAMENPGCVTFRDQLLFRSRATDGQRADRDNTIAHEMAHMWFGDVVTMRWWDDLWLNESFAEYLACRVCSELGDANTWVAFGIERKSWGYAADRRPSTHPVAGNGSPDAESALNDFDGISYAKGAAALRQLNARLGDDAFLGGLRSYISDHAFGNAELADLLEAWTAAGAADVQAWAGQWLRIAGADTLWVDGDQVVRTPPADRPAEREHALQVGAYGADGAVSARADVLLASARTTVAVPADAALVLLDAGDQTWAKIGLPQSAWSAMPDLLPRLDPTARVVVWNALQLAVADADLDPSLAVDIVAGAVPSETGDATLSVVLRWASDELARFVPDARRGAAAAAVAGAAQAAMAAAAPGSGRQLAAFRGLVAATDDRDGLAGWLDGGAPDGVVVDADLRWRILARLSALGAVDAARIDAELAADDSSEGAEQAARCRAALADPQAKAAAWRLLMSDGDCPNSLLYATARGFWSAGQQALTEPYVERYFAEIAATAGLRSGWVVSRVAALAYPSTAVSRATLARTTDLLASPLPAGVRRSVLDGGDDLRRAVEARERFA